MINEIFFNCGKPLRALFTKLFYENKDSGYANYVGIVKVTKIGQSATKLLIKYSHILL